jgi:hypothetical protein
MDEENIRDFPSKGRSHRFKRKKEKTSKHKWNDDKGSDIYALEMNS